MCLPVELTSSLGLLTHVCFHF